MICENCSQNATCKEGQCVCKEGYTGNGVTCDSKFLKMRLQRKKYFNISVICENCSHNATCKGGQCVCKEGYTGNGVTCDSKFLKM